MSNVLFVHVGDSLDNLPERIPFLDDVRFEFKEIGEEITFGGKLEDEDGVGRVLRGLLILLITHESNVLTVLKARDYVAVAQAI